VGTSEKREGKGKGKGAKKKEKGPAGQQVHSTSIPNAEEKRKKGRGRRGVLEGKRKEGGRGNRTGCRPEWTVLLLKIPNDHCPGPSEKEGGKKEKRKGKAPRGKKGGKKRRCPSSIFFPQVAFQLQFRKEKKRERGKKKAHLEKKREKKEETSGEPTPEVWMYLHLFPPLVHASAGGPEGGGEKKERKGKRGETRAV